MVGGGLFAAQILGFIRQIIIGYLLGTGSEADALSAAMAPIETWWTIFAVALIFGFAPFFSEERADGGYRVQGVLWPVVQLSAVATVLSILLAKPILLAFAPGLDKQAILLGVRLLQILSASIIPISACFVYAAFLYSRRRFLIASLPHATVNLTTIIGALALFDRWGADGFAIGYIVGAWLQLIVNHLYVRPLMAQQKGKVAKLSIREVVSAPGEILVQSTANELNIAVSRAYASTFGLGMTAAFEFGFKLLRVPAALLVIPLSQALLPELVGDSSGNGHTRDGLRATRKATWLAAGLSAAGFAVMILIRQPLVSLLFERGEFGEASTAAVALILLSYAPAMLGRVIADFLSRLLFAMSKVRVPAVASVVAVAVNLIICLLIPSTLPELIGLGAFVGFAVAAVTLIRYVGVLQRDA